MQRALLIAGLALLAVPLPGREALAQRAPGPTLTIEGTSTPFRNFRDAPALDGAEQRTQSVSGRFSVPFTLDARTFLFLDGSYRQVRLDARGGPEALGSIDPVVHDVAVGLGLLRVLSPRWTMLLRAGPSLASNFDESIGSEDLTVGGVAVFTRQFDRHWSASFGAAYFTSLGIPFPVPVLGAAWTDGGHWRVSATLPSSLEGWYTAGNVAEFGLRMNLDGGDHHVPGLFEADEPRIRRLGVNFGPAAKLNVSRGISLDLSAGWSVEQIRLLDGDDEIDGGEFDVESRPFARAGVNLAL